MNPEVKDKIGIYFQAYVNYGQDGGAGKIVRRAERWMEKYAALLIHPSSLLTCLLHVLLVFTFALILIFYLTVYIC